MPNFKHDDPSNTFHGTIYNGWDVYTGRTASGETEVILRYGDRPEEYKAQPMHIALLLTNKDPDYDEAIGLIQRNNHPNH